MTSKYRLLLATIFTVSGLLSAPALSVASDDPSNCETHAKHINEEIGVEKSLESYDVLHGDREDKHRILEELKRDYPDVEHELIEFIRSGCSDVDLDAQAHDGGY